MTIKTDTHISILARSFEQRKSSQTNYSKRAFARDLDVHPATLSLVMKGSRFLTKEKALEVATALDLSPRDYTVFLEGVQGAGSQEDSDGDSKRHILGPEESNFSVLAEWEHYVVLTLFDLKDFDYQVQNIAFKTGMSESRTETVLKNLQQCGLLVDKNGSLTKKYGSVRTTEDVVSEALRASHIETLEIGKKKLREIDVNNRDFSEVTVAMSPSLMPELKLAIRDFRKKIMELSERAEKTEVYKVALQVYPMTILENK